MKEVPEIAPDIRGLLEEIVADPRSTIRLAPRRALHTWFHTGETARASDVAHTTAERHLLEVHREEVAALLCQASWISYWKAPILSYRPVGSDGRLYGPTEREQDWRERAEREVHTSGPRRESVDLLRQCLVGIGHGQGWAMGQASLALVPRDLTRFYITLSIPWNRPHASISLLNRFARHARPMTTRLEAVLSLAARTCSLGMLKGAHDLYAEATLLEPRSACARLCAFNLSCFLGADELATSEAMELGRSVSREDPQAAEVGGLLEGWIKSRPESERRAAKATAKRLHGRIPDAAAGVCRGYEL